MKYLFIQEQSKEHKVVRLCRAMDVSESGYYDWLEREPSDRDIDNIRLVRKIQQSHKNSGGVYGSPKIHKDLVELGESCSKNRIARLMAKHGIQSKLSRKFVVTTDSKNTIEAAPDLLQRNFGAQAPNQRWVSDTTFIPTRQGWLYLAVVLDLYSRSIVGWSMSNKNDAQLVCDALTMAVWKRKPKPGLILHSDQGSTYASRRYQSLLKEHKLRCSMARKGECLDNAVAESFFGSLKNELVYHDDFKTKSEAKKKLFQYMEVFYNRRRRHAYLGYLTPYEFEVGAA